MKENNKVLLGMSGGTDSSVAALLLQDAGYEVTGITFRFSREMFQEKIIHYFIQEYMAGRTPVPCTLCNNYLKWPLLQQVADEKGIYHLATGHYVNKQKIDGYWYITCGNDTDKDQSFFLWGLPQSILERMCLPMGGLTKTRVREIAAARGFLKAAKKRDSLGVCFCPMDYRTFLKAHVPKGKITPGNFYDEQGQKIGKFTLSDSEEDWVFT